MYVWHTLQRKGKCDIPEIFKQCKATNLKMKWNFLIFPNKIFAVIVSFAGWKHENVFVVVTMMTMITLHDYMISYEFNLTKIMSVNNIMESFLVWIFLCFLFSLLFLQTQTHTIWTAEICSSKCHALNKYQFVLFAEALNKDIPNTFKPIFIKRIWYTKFHWK